jgi:hypothetical protein
MSKQLQTATREAVAALAEDRGATLEAIALQAELMSLGCVVAVASDNGRTTPPLEVVAGVVALFLEEAANALEEHPLAGTEPNRAAAARAALGLEPGIQGKPLRGRRGQPGRVGTIARWLAYEPASLFKPRQDGRSPFAALIDDVAEQLVRREVAHRVSEQRLAQQVRRPPLESAMKVDWLGRFERYYGIWASVSGLRFDIELAVANQRDGNAADLDHFVRKSLWYYALFVTDLIMFIRDCGGLWIMPDPKAEQLLADAVWLIRKPTPLTELDESMLRLAIAGWEELAPFMQATYSDAAMRRLTDTWRSWIVSCDCPDLKRPRKHCAVHQCTAWATSFMDNLNQQWDLLADWYDVPRPLSLVKPQELTTRPIPVVPVKD